MGQYPSRQDILHKEVSDLKMRNWMCANIAMRDTSKALAVCLHHRISQIHKQMSQAVGRGRHCTKNCTWNRTDRCSICERWVREIIAICEPDYRSRINWSRLNSSQWPHNPYEVARALIPKAHRLYYKCSEFHEDFRFSLSFIENCTEIPVSRSLCEKSWQFRSRLNRKNNTMRMSLGDLEDGISSMISLVSLPALGGNGNTVEKLRSLTDADSDEDNSNEGCCVM